MKKVLILFIICAISIDQMSAHIKDTIQNISSLDNNLSQSPHQKTSFLEKPYAGFIIPTVFISYGVIAHNNDFLKQLDRHTHKVVSNHFTGKIHIDDYTQYVPAIAVYGLDLAGLKAKHSVIDRTFLMASSYLISTASVQIVKRTTKIQRPDESSRSSFPSGHTATAFVGAHLLFKEYKDTSPWIGIAGYVVASGTGAMRVLNKRHWVSDVVIGAGIGMLSVELSYLLLPAFQKLTGKKETQTNLVVAPVVSYHNYGLGLAYSF